MTARGPAHVGQLKQFLVHLSRCRVKLLAYSLEGKVWRLTYLPASLLTILDGISNRQFGQYHVTISSIVHLGQRICWQSSQKRRCSSVYREKLARGDLGSNVRSSSSSPFAGEVPPLIGVDTSVQGQLMKVYGKLIVSA